MISKANQELILNEATDRYSSFLPAFWAMVLLTLIALPSHAQPFQPVPDQVESATAPARAGDDALPFKPRSASAFPRPHSISIGHVSQEKVSAETGAAPRPGTPRKIGFGRDIAELGSTADTSARLQWQSTPQGGKSTRRSAGDKSEEPRTFWSPYVEGEEATLELELPLGISQDTLEIVIPRVSHFLSSPSPHRGNIEKIGQAASCEIDVLCYSGWSVESNATAKMIFVKSGSSYECSGTLLNNRVWNFTPHFPSANHCISSQTVASTPETYWFYCSAAVRNIRSPQSSEARCLSIYEA